MWIVNLALRRPYTFIVLAIFILISGSLAIVRTPKDIFPGINIPVVSVIWTFSGMQPSEIENHITSVYERLLTTTVDNIEHIESESLSGVAVVKIFLQPTANVATDVSQVTAISQNVLKQLPPGITPPLVLSYSASNVPVLRLGLSSQKFSEQQLSDFALNFVRTQLVTVPGASVPYQVRPPVPGEHSPQARVSCWFCNDHDSAIHKARRRAGDDLIRFRQTLGDYQF
jgi:multidrug efflux pump subunit AcrB